MPKLIKASTPGWEKDFASESEARDELLKYICKACLVGGEWDDIDENGLTTGITVTEDPPDQSDIHALLATPCGCEFLLEEDQR